MSAPKPYGFYLLQKDLQNNKVLKDLLQFLKSTAPGRNHTFSYIEADTSLHPQMSLCENLQLELGFRDWKDFEQGLKPEWAAIVSLIKRPTILAQEAETWERFLVSYLKGLLLPTQNLLIDMNEEKLSAFQLQHFKKTILSVTQEKTVLLASANSSLWLDGAHTLVSRKEYEFDVQKLDSEMVKKYWAA